MNSKTSPPAVGFLVAVVFGLVALAGCSTQHFYASYYVDPRPPRASYADVKAPAHPKPVYLVFDMYSAEGSFPEATRKLGRKIVRVLEDCQLFSTVSKVGSENIARIQVSMRETAVLTGADTKSLPEGLTSGLHGSRGAIVYQFTASFQAPGQELVKKVYPHAVHIVEGNSLALADVLPMTASHAVDAMVEQVMLHFLRDLQKEGKL
ncbi:MAG TPA: hypothetical protein VEO53_10835 [Candidatus Binatia bacterium]|nr:hypothetical protein [Candidatus Binatia bacterium]